MSDQFVMWTALVVCRVLLVTMYTFRRHIHVLLALAGEVITCTLDASGATFAVVLAVAIVLAFVALNFLPSFVWGLDGYNTVVDVFD